MDENVQVPNARTIGLTFGLYAGAISTAVFLIASFLGYNPFGGGLNYVGTVASIVLLVFAHKKFKDSGDGFMSYGQGMGIGFWFTVASALLAIVVMYVYINYVDYSPLQLMLDEQTAKMEEAGSDENAIETAGQWTKKLFWVFAVIGALIGGMVIALIVTIFTQKKNPEPFA
ncbi:MAG: DUF4199 domain-containing protein [Cytophagales bacterium]|jgi:hypothetical protein|nr:DUF4199 domain-containing protein [Cytophagales bacterium]MCA6368158.1 DUF4199 domain-containing protein [Cytophagales bacterium]MCA6372031.1 DUF4199 domain-containing protein [Cytophagales bacterium]MCA6375791.1 DUF4199 domain-containing protein [Cytophagales bacterium]MCA6385657.1 DUF4199 domain-containing protein [Cytophagales bacterium]